MSIFNFLKKQSVRLVIPTRYDNTFVVFQSVEKTNRVYCIKFCYYINCYSDNIISDIKDLGTADKICSEFNFIMQRYRP